MHNTAVIAPDATGYSVYAKLVTVSFIWGGTFVAGKYIAADIAPLLSACLRFVLASATLIAVLAMRRKVVIGLTVRQLFAVIALGFFGIFAYNIFFFYGLHYINASRASLIVALNPALIALAAFTIGKEKLGAGNIMGIAACIAGAATVIVSKDAAVLQPVARAWIGDALILGCVLSWVLYSVCSKRLVREIGPLHTVAYSVIAGTLMLCCAALLYGDINRAAIGDIRQNQLLSLLYLGVIGSALAYIWYYDGIQKIGATRSGVFIALNPLSAVLLGLLLLGESLSPPMLLGGLLVISGIYFCNKPARHSEG